MLLLWLRTVTPQRTVKFILIPAIKAARSPRLEGAVYRQTRRVVFIEILWIHFTYPSGKEAVERVLERGGKTLEGDSNEPSVTFESTNQICYRGDISHTSSSDRTVDVWPPLKQHPH